MSGSNITTNDAEEFTQALGQVVGGSWRQIALGIRLGVPKALGLLEDDWVKQRLGGYMRLAVSERKEAVVELTAEGMSTRQIGRVLGVSHPTVLRDQESGTNVPAETENTSSNADSESIGGTNVPPAQPDKEAKTQARLERLSQREQDALDRQDDRLKLFHGDFNDMEIPSVDCIITDPPYSKKWLKSYAELSYLASQVLPEGGQMLVMIGQSWLADAISQLSKHMKYQWTLAYLTPGGSTQVFGRTIKSNWKPIVLMVKGRAREHTQDTFDSIASDGRDVRFHGWGQSVAGFSKLVEAFTVKNEVVLDPFMGGGTTGVAALLTDRRFIGVEVDSGSFVKAEERLNKCLTKSESP